MWTASYTSRTTEMDHFSFTCIDKWYMPNIFKQVRRLLHRAHAVSKGWDDAPVVLCGDFNCVPKVNSFAHLSSFLKGISA